MPGSTEGAADNGPLVSDGYDLWRTSLELSHLLGRLAARDDKARAELVSKILQDLSNYKETNLAINQNCTNATVLPLPIILEIT